MSAQSAGCDPERLARIDHLIESRLNPEGIAGAVTLVSRNGEIAQFRAYGESWREEHRPMRTDSIFRLYSMTKPVTMVALLMLFERGKLRLTDPVSRFIPEFAETMVAVDETDDNTALEPQRPPVTIWHLMTHTAGLSYHHLDFGLVERRYRESGTMEERSLEETARIIAGIPLAFQPGSRWRYSMGHDIGARVVEVASGMSYGDFLERELFQPLGITDTGFYVPEEKIDRLTAEYGNFDVRDPRIIAPKSDEEYESPVPRLLRRPGEGIESTPHEVHRGGHGLLGTAGDYHRFCRMLLGGGELGGVRILGRKSVELMSRNQLAPAIVPPDLSDIGEGFGLGVSVTLEPGYARNLGSRGTYAWGGAAGTIFWIDPVEKLIGILMIQVQANRIQIGTDFRNAVYQALV